MPHDAIDDLSGRCAVLTVQLAHAADSALEMAARVDELERRADKAMAMLQSWVKADDIVEVLAILTAPVRS